jgi:hypothetical protein
MNVCLQQLLKLAIPAVIVSTAGLTNGAVSNFSYIEEPVSPRNLAMGTAGTAMDGGGFSFYNPALPSLLKIPYVSYEYGRNAGDFGRGIPEFMINFPTWFAGFSFQTQSTDFQRADETGILPGATGSEQASMASLAGGFTKENFSIGIAVNGFQHRIADYTSYGVSGSAGLIYNIIEGKLNAGLSLIHGAGRSTGFLDTVRIWHREFPLTGRAGVCWNDTIGNMPYTAAMDVVYNRNYDIITVPVGAELWILPSLAIRLGKRFNHPTDLFSAGVGLAWDNLAFDAAFTPCRFVSDMNLKWSMGIKYSLKNFKKEKVLIKTPAVTVPVKPVIETKQEVKTEKELSDSSVTADSILTEENKDSTILPPDSIIPSTLDSTVKGVISDSTKTGTEKAILNGNSSGEVNNKAEKGEQNSEIPSPEKGNAKSEDNEKILQAPSGGVKDSTGNLSD